MSADAAPAANALAHAFVAKNTSSPAQPAATEPPAPAATPSPTTNAAQPDASSPDDKKQPAAKALPSSPAKAVVVHHAPDGVLDPVEGAIAVVRLSTSNAISLPGGKARCVDDEDVAAIFADWAENTSVTSVDLGLNRVTDIGATAIAAALRDVHQTVLADLDLSANAIGDPGATALFHALPPTLTRLDLSGNKLTDAAVAALVAARPAGLASLHLRDTPGLTDQALLAVAGWLKDPACPLSNLHLSGNRFTDAALPALAEALVVNTRLVDLGLGNTNFFDFAPLVKAVEANRSLLSLVVAHNGKRVELPEVAAVLRRNKALARERNDDPAVLRSELAKARAVHQQEAARLKDQVRQLELQLAMAAQQRPGQAAAAAAPAAA